YTILLLCAFRLSLFYLYLFPFFFFNATATTEIYTLSLHDALPIYAVSNDERTDFHPYKSLYEAKVQVIGGSDHMVKTDPNSAVNPYNPFLSIATVVNRKTRSGLTFNAAERISRQEALKMYTINNAHASFEEDIKGSIERDKLADMVVLSADILSCPEDEIKDIFPILTIIGGKE